MGKYLPGESGNPNGKPKGAEAKVNKEARQLFVETLQGQVGHIHNAFEQVRVKDPAKYLELFAKYAQYFVPKKVDVTSGGDEIKQVFKIGNVEIEL